MADVKLFGALWDTVRKLANFCNDLGNLMYRTRVMEGVIGGDHALVVGTTDTTMIRLTGTVRYVIDGVEYVSGDAQEVDIATGEVTEHLWGAWRININKLGVVSTQRATANGTSGTMAFANEQDALLGLSQIAITDGLVEIGYLTIDAAANGFTPGTDNPDAGDAQVDTNTYTNVRVPRLDNGLTADVSVGLSEGTSADEYATGTINARTNGLNVAEIAADVTAAWADADIITTSGNFGGHLIVTDLAGTATISISQTGIPGAAQTVDSASAAVVNAALDAVQAALPVVFTVVGREVTRAQKATFTYNTDDLAGTDGVTTWTDESNTPLDRGTVAGAGVGNEPPTLDNLKFPGGHSVMLGARVQGDRGQRHAPIEFQDAVELHYRKSGRHATIVWIPVPVCQWQLRITMRPNDPALRAWQAGDAETEPMEIFEITHWNEEAGLYQGYELEDLGVSGLITMLEKSDSWSGTGQFGSIEEAMAYQVQQQKDTKEKLEKYLRGEVEAAGRSIAHVINDEPYLTVGIDLSSPEGADAEESS